MLTVLILAKDTGTCDGVVLKERLFGTLGKEGGREGMDEFIDHRLISMGSQ